MDMTAKSPPIGPMARYLGINFFAYHRIVVPMSADHRVVYHRNRQLLPNRPVLIQSDDSVPEDYVCYMCQHFEGLSCDESDGDSVDNHVMEVDNKVSPMAIIKAEDNLIPAITGQQMESIGADVDIKPIVDQFNEDIDIDNKEMIGKKVRFDLKPTLIGSPLPRQTTSQSTVQLKPQLNETIGSQNFLSLVKPKDSSNKTATKVLNNLDTNADKPMNKALNCGTNASHSSVITKSLLELALDMKPKKPVVSRSQSFKTKITLNKAKSVTNKWRNNVFKMSEIMTRKSSQNGFGYKGSVGPMDSSRLKFKAKNRLSVTKASIFTLPSDPYKTTITVANKLHFGTQSCNDSLLKTSQSNKPFVQNMNAKENPRSETPKTQSNAFLQKRLIEWQNSGCPSTPTANASNNKSEFKGFVMGRAHHSTTSALFNDESNFVDTFFKHNH